jgi:hypothetical protein
LHELAEVMNEFEKSGYDEAIGSPSIKRVSAARQSGISRSVIPEPL